MQAGNTTAQRARIDARRLERRRAAITDYAILDTAAEQQYDAVAELAARVAGTPVGLVSFVDERREWVKAAHGRAIAEVDRQRAFGGVLVGGPGETLIVPDATRDQRFAGHPWVAHGPRASFYVGLPLRTPGGVAIGTVAVLDPRPRADGEEVARALQPAARILEEMLEHRREEALSGALTCVVDFDFRFLRVSRGWEQLLGHPANELIGRRYTDFVHPDDLDRTQGEARLRARGEETRAYENRYLTRDGEIRWLSWESEPVPEEGVMYAVAKDITDHKRDELALEESERRFRLLAENATDMIGQWDLEARLVYLSSAARSLLGYAPEELIGRYGYELIHPDDRRLVVSNHEALLRGSDRVRVVFRIRHRDGHWVWAESIARLLRDAAGQPAGIQTATRDMTESKRAMDALQRAEERFRKAFDEGPVGMAIVALNGRFQRVNRALGDLLGHPPAELIGLSYDDLAESGADIGAAVRDLLAGDGRCLNVEQKLARRDGGSVWVSMSASLMRDSAGEPVAFLAQFLDVSQRHRAEAASRRAREAAERANRAKSEFLARMSHELRTPLNAILGFAQLLELDELSPQQKDSVARIVRGGRHLLEVINDVLDISRIEAGQLPIELRSVDASELVDEVVLMLAPLAAERGMTVRSDVEAGLCARADRQRLKQVVLNLVSNAIKYAPGQSEILVRTVAQEDRVRVSVVDEGPGISDEQAERIFMPFERLGEHAHVEGTGLGLALSRNLVRAMGGEIGVRRSGPGSEFWIDLAAAERDLERAADTGRDPDAAAALAARNGNGDRTLLYIEDSPSNAEMVEHMLALRPGVELVVAADGTSGIEIAHHRHPDAILLDMSLPDMSGEQVLERLKADPDTGDIPVVAVTADAGPGREAAARGAGAVAFQTKPIELPQFLRALDDALGS